MSFERPPYGLTDPKEDANTPMTTANGAAPNHEASPASPTHSASSSVSPRASLHGHGRTWSRLSNQSRHQPRSNRFSLQFPIQPSGSNTPVQAASPTLEPAASSPDVQAALDGGAVSDSTSFLTLIASQERKVLELKEEVLRAEADLDKLKKQWALHEAKRKREDVKRSTKLQTLQTSLPAADSEDDTNGSNAWMQQEMARRKALLSRSNTTGGRTVIPGQRHTRALSLLTPARDNVRELPTLTAQRLPPPRRDSLRGPMLQSTEAVVPAARPPLVPKGHEYGDSARSVDKKADPNLDSTQRASIDQDALLRTSKKMASEFKDGLWTFWEDLKQATVGEDHHSVPPPRKKSSTQTLDALRKQGSKNSLRPSSRGSSTVSKASVETKRQVPARKQSAPSAIPDLADPSFWSNNGVLPPTQGTQPQIKKATASKHTRQPSVKRLSAVSNDAWDTWDDSPEQSRSSSSVTSDTNTLPSSTVSVSPRSSGLNAFEPLEPTKRDSIPWPALKKSAGSLRRTASHLMSEWEKSLTPSPGEEFTGQEDYMGAGAEAAAFGAKKRIA